MVKDFTYYTGLIMEGYTADLGYTIASGGRYDQLLKSFGEIRTGLRLGFRGGKTPFGFGAAGKLPKIEEKCEVLITPQAGTKEHWPQALALAKELRKLGYPTEVNPCPGSRPRHADGKRAGG